MNIWILKKVKNGITSYTYENKFEGSNFIMRNDLEEIRKIVLGEKQGKCYSRGTKVFLFGATVTLVAAAAGTIWYFFFKDKDNSDDNWDDDDWDDDDDDDLDDDDNSDIETDDFVIEHDIDLEEEGKIN